MICISLHKHPLQQDGASFFFPKAASLVPSCETNKHSYRNMPWRLHVNAFKLFGGCLAISANILPDPKERFQLEYFQEQTELDGSF